MTAVTIKGAQSTLTDLIHRLSSGEEVLITENDQPVARLVHTSAVASRNARQLGTMKGSVLYVAPDFDASRDSFPVSTPKDTGPGTLRCQARL
jgi:antitoxin (DNA-binding transcriptional repressor) of toxin-antitoxin stability system